MAGKRGRYLAHTEDVNSDGYPDLMVKFQDSDGWIEAGHGWVMLKGNLNNGIAFWAMDTICIIPPEK